jgi:(1->4)-alpha-D-glucan 1-alpha-D-glucosylmutase
MKVPGATYRLQFRNGTTFARAAELAPYFASLGITHIYGSPAFQAEPDSTHGYDVTDFRVLDASLGGEADFQCMIAAFQAEGLGFITDFVPNHMSASPRNPFWRNVLEWGQASDYAQFFDIDWSAPKLLVPALATAYGKALAAGKFGLHFDEDDGCVAFTYGALKLPLTPPSYGQFLVRGEGEEFAERARRFAVATPDTSTALKGDLAGAARDPGFKQVLEQSISTLVQDKTALHELHEAQGWRLTHWRAARETLTYRRFFEISDLVGLKVENPRVFDALHAKLGVLIAEGKIDGVRLDHVDGLADPKAYLERLQKTLDEPEPLYLVVEKILGPDEDLHSDWPVAGTTGYEFIGAVAGALVDPAGEASMTRAYHRFLAEDVDYQALVMDTKRRTLTRNLTGELDRLKDMASALAARHLTTRDFGTDTLRRGIIELIAAFPVYRTYVDIAGARDIDKAILGKALGDAKSTREVDDEDAIDFLGRVLTLDFESPEDQAGALEFATRFQQTSGPVMAKALEDTTFYRYNRLIALNEVGGEPDRFGAPLTEFHASMQRRLRRQAAGLSATATHDTKRGEDARARLYVLSEMPDTWSEAVCRWAGLTAAFRADCAGMTAPEPAIEWMFYQALAGAWPQDLEIDDGAALTTFAQRMTEFMLKAVREAKVHTSWAGQNEDYETAIRRFAEACLDPARARGFLDDFLSTCRPVFVAGALNSLAQTAIKLTAPGVTDIYQGTEFWDLSLVDPDNRRPVDFEDRQHWLKALSKQPVADLLRDWRSGAIKMRLLRAGLELRAAGSDVFETGAYVPLEVRGNEAEHVLAFARVLVDRVVVTVVPRLCLGLLAGAAAPLIPRQNWKDTIIDVPEDLKWPGFRDIVTCRDITPGELMVGEILKDAPVAVLAATSKS